MTTLVSEILDRVKITLQDTTSVRWPELELLRWVNDAQRKIVELAPDANVEQTVVTLATGTRQSLPSGALRLVDASRNMGSGGTTPGNAVRLTQRHVLDAQVPAWHTTTASSSIQHVLYDKRVPKVFWVYPPASTGASVELFVSKPPTTLSSTASAIGLDDVYVDSIVDYVLYRAYQKDVDYANNAANVKWYWESFIAGLSGKEGGDVGSEMVPIKR